jgi:hypothetical protein
MSGTAAEVNPVNSVDDRAVTCPGPITTAIMEEYGRTFEDTSTATRTGWSMSAERRVPEAVEIFDTTLRDGTQLEGISLTVDDKLRIAEQLDRLGVHWIEGGYPGPTRRTRSSSAGPRRAAPRELHARGVRLHPAPARQGRRRPHPAEPGGGRHRRGVHRGQELGLPRHRGPAHHPRRGRGHGGRLSVEFLECGPAGDGRRRALLRRLQAQPRVRPAGARGGAQRGASHLVLCDTNGGSLPHEVERDHGGRGGPLRRRRGGRHPLPQRHRVRGGQLHGRRAGRAPPRCRAP